MNSMLIWVVVAALSSSMLTLALGWLAYRVWVRPQLDAELVRIQAEFERHVKRGVIEAGEQLLPAFREQVRLGFQDALKQSHAAGIAEGTAKIVAGSTELVMDSLSNLFGLKKK
jgi:hypothetical protein